MWLNNSSKLFRKSRLFLLSCLFFVLGIFGASFLSRNQLSLIKEFSGIILLLFFLCFLVGFITQKRAWQALGLWAGFFFLGVSRLILALPDDSPEAISYYHNQNLLITGWVADYPVTQLDKQQLLIESIYLDNLDRKVSGKILVTTELYPEYSFGEKLILSGRVQAPVVFPDFDYQRYLAKSGIYSVSYYPKITSQGLIDLSFWQQIRQKIFSFKDRLVLTIDQGLGEPEASLVKAMVLGDKSTMTQELKQSFSKAGISHITAISGMHIGILIAILFQVLLNLGFTRQKIFILSFSLLIFYIIMIGAPASAVRAGIMGCLVLLSFNLGRFHKIENLLALAAALMLMVNPQLLRSDVGFQLSFLAVVGIWFFYPRINEVFKQYHQEEFLSKSFFDVLNITICAQVFTLPIVAYNFSYISIIAPLANLLVLWTLPLILIFSLTGLLAGLILPQLTWWFFLPANLLLNYVYQIGSFLGNVSWFSFDSNLSFWWWAVYYLVLLFFMFYLNTKDYFELSFRQKNSKLEEK